MFDLDLYFVNFLSVAWRQMINTKSNMCTNGKTFILFIDIPNNMLYRSAALKCIQIVSACQNTWIVKSIKYSYKAIHYTAWTCLIVYWNLWSYRSNTTGKYCPLYTVFTCVWQGKPVIFTSSYSCTFCILCRENTLHICITFLSDLNTSKASHTWASVA
jgi:hypothetical protein